MLGKAGRTRYYSAYEEHAEAMRQAIQDRVTALRRTIAPQDDGPDEEAWLQEDGLDVPEEVLPISTEADSEPLVQPASSL